MNELQIFNHQQFGEIRTVSINNEPWFVGKDVAAALGYSNPRKALIDHVDTEDKGVTKCDTLGGTQEMTIINEHWQGMSAKELTAAPVFKQTAAYRFRLGHATMYYEGYSGMHKKEVTGNFGKQRWLQEPFSTGSWHPMGLKYLGGSMSFRKDGAREKQTEIH